MNKTNIEYLDYTWNITHGCSPIREGCKNCWAKDMAKRLAAMGVKGYSKDDPFKVTFCPEQLNDPLKVKKPSRIGVSFMGDLFHEKVDYQEQEDIFNAMCNADWHTYLILTKRPQGILDFIQQIEDWDSSELTNIQPGVSISTQKDADEMIPILLQIKSMFPNLTVFVSIEPLLENISLHNFFWEDNPNYMPPRFLDEGETYNEPHEIKIDSNETLNGIIIGCESGPKRRPCKIEWIEDMVEQGKSAGISVFVKQAQDKNGKIIKMPEINGKVYNQLPEEK